MSHWQESETCVHEFYIINGNILSIIVCIQELRVMSMIMQQYVHNQLSSYALIFHRMACFERGKKNSQKTIISKVLYVQNFHIHITLCMFLQNYHLSDETM